MNFAILGTGNIARQMAATIQRLSEDISVYAVASRTLDKAQNFAEDWHIAHAYGTYEKLINDENVNLVYIATPHAMHYENALLCLQHNKAILVEKAFTANATQAKHVFRLAAKKNIFVTEAIWTRYMPSIQIITDLLRSGIIGRIVSVHAEFTLPISHIKRMQDPSLAGGALLDLGIYPLTFASMFLGNDIDHFKTHCDLYPTGVDASDEITLYYKSGATAILRCSMMESLKNEGTIIGEHGCFKIKDLNNFSSIEIYDSTYKLLKEVSIPKQITGYEYEVLACKNAIEKGELQCDEMPHTETIKIMELADELRANWGVKYPFE